MGWKVVCHRRARDNTSEPRAKQSSPCRLVSGTEASPPDRMDPRQAEALASFRGPARSAGPAVGRRPNGARRRLAPPSNRDGQDRNRRQAHQLFGNAPQEQMSEAGAAMRAEDHQIVLAFFELGEQGGG